ncbi:MAG TPA: hypothetical protein ENK89_03055 [Desulfobulbaceae bacterium]|nr:hypothetical protein [Desulfobulbaceae bacterium]HHD64686.1 hypothetical protein [Desulfobulbaceae bacterium]
MDPEKLMNSLSEELYSNIQEMKREDDVEEKLRYSEIVRNLSQSLGVFLRLISDVMDADFDDFDDDYDEYEE